MMANAAQNKKVAGTRSLTLIVLLLLAASFLLAARPAQAATTFTANSTSDRGDLVPGNGRCYTGVDLVVQGKECTLRAAIQEANATPEADTIEFDIPGTGVNTIAPTSELPTVTRPVTIDGYSQPGAQPNTKTIGSDAVLKIEISGAKTFEPGLQISAANSTVKGLVVNNWSSHGIRIDGANATGNKITGNHIGTDGSGTQKLGNGQGVRVDDGSNNTIGGTTPAARNVISGNANGVYLGDGGVVKGNRVLGNYIGTDATGTKDLGNSSYGVAIEDTPDNTTKTIIGGATAGERNVISGNDSDGVGIYGSNNKVAGNYIGTDASGTQKLGNSGSGVHIFNGQNNTVGGLEAGQRNVVSGNAFGGIHVSGADATGNRVVGNYIGTDASGKRDLGNVEQGVFVDRAPRNVVGGTTVGARNVISGNDSEGVLVVGPGAGGNRVVGNYVGTDRSGAAPLGNSGVGVHVSEAANTTIGGATTGARNVICTNGGQGVRLLGGGATNNTVAGNYVGVDASGLKGLGNSLGGIAISGAPDNTVGGTDAAARNVVSGNGFQGVLILGADATGNEVIGNHIGTDKNGTASLGNSLHGVHIESASNNTIGGTQAGARNVISGNTVDGVSIFGSTATGNRLLSNSIFANGDEGIDLIGTDGPEPDDPGDADAGPNNLQNKPALSAAKKGATGTTTLRGKLNSTPGKTFRVQFFSNPSGTDEGKTLLGSKSVTTDGTGNVSFTFSTKKTIRLGQNITATATSTSTGDTSEFSAPRRVVAG